MFGNEVLSAVESGVGNSCKSPWQNRIAERWVGSCRRDLLDHVLALNALNLQRFLSEYAGYHEDRRHLGLNKETPDDRPQSN